MDIHKVTVLGTTPIDQASQVERVTNTQAVRPIDELDRTDQTKNKKALEETQKSMDIQTHKMEYGYNVTTDDLVIKITKADGTEGQYPTETMMKLKALLKEEFLEMKDENY